MGVASFSVHERPASCALVGAKLIGWTRPDRGAQLQLSFFLQGIGVASLRPSGHRPAPPPFVLWSGRHWGHNDCLSLSLSVRSLRPSVRPSACRSACLSVCLPVCLLLSLYISLACLSVCLACSLCLPLPPGHGGWSNPMTAHNERTLSRAWTFDKNACTWHLCKTVPVNKG